MTETLMRPGLFFSLVVYCVLKAGINYIYIYCERETETMVETIYCRHIPWFLLKILPQIVLIKLINGIRYNMTMMLILLYYKIICQYLLISFSILFSHTPSFHSLLLFSLSMNVTNRRTFGIEKKT